jgi:hypothetical protein
VLQAGLGKITITPSSLTVQGPQVALGNPGSPVPMSAVPKLNVGVPVVTEPMINSSDTEKAAQMAIPKVELDIDLDEIELPPQSYGSFIATMKLSLSGDFEATGKNSVNPLTFNQDGFTLESKNQLANAIETLSIKNIDLTQMSISLSCSAISNLTTTLIAVRLNEYKAIFSNKILKLENQLEEIEGTCNLTLDITLNPNPPTAQPVSEFQKLEDYLSTELSTVEAKIAGAAVGTWLVARQALPYAEDVWDAIKAVRFVFIVAAAAA